MEQFGPEVARCRSIFSDRGGGETILILVGGQVHEAILFLVTKDTGKGGLGSGGILRELGALSGRGLDGLIEEPAITTKRVKVILGLLGVVGSDYVNE